MLSSTTNIYIQLSYIQAHPCLRKIYYSGGGTFQTKILHSISFTVYSTYMDVCLHIDTYIGTHTHITYSTHTCTHTHTHLTTHKYLHTYSIHLYLTPVVNFGEVRGPNYPNLLSSLPRCCPWDLFRSFKVCSDAKERVECGKQREATAPIYP